MNLLAAISRLRRYQSVRRNHAGTHLRTREARQDLIREIRSGLHSDTRQWRGSLGNGGHRNRRQRKHTAAGGSIYRNGLHWLIAENLTAA
jgi:hypothetical protein